MEANQAQQLFKLWHLNGIQDKVKNRESDILYTFNHIDLIMSYARLVISHVEKLKDYCLANDTYSDQGF